MSFTEHPVGGPPVFSVEDEIAFILARYDHHAIPPAVYAVVERMRQLASAGDAGCESDECGCEASEHDDVGIGP